MKNNMKYFILAFTMGIACGSSFGLGLSVAMKNILFLPISTSIGTVFGALVGMAIKKHKDSNE